MLSECVQFARSFFLSSSLSLSRVELSRDRNLPHTFESPFFSFSIYAQTQSLPTPKVVSDMWVGSSLSHLKTKTCHPDVTYTRLSWLPHETGNYGLTLIWVSAICFRLTFVYFSNCISVSFCSYPFDTFAKLSCLSRLNLLHWITTMVAHWLFPREHQYVSVPLVLWLERERDDIGFLQIRFRFFFLTRIEVKRRFVLFAAAAVGWMWQRWRQKRGENASRDAFQKVSLF